MNQVVLDQCDYNVFNNGVAVMITHTIPSQELETWVKKIADLSGQQVDWHYMGGRAVIRAIGDLDLVDSIIDELLPEHDELYKKASQKYTQFECNPPRNFPRRELNGVG